MARHAGTMTRTTSLLIWQTNTTHIKMSFHWLVRGVGKGGAWQWLATGVDDGGRGNMAAMVSKREIEVMMTTTATPLLPWQVGEGDNNDKQ